MKNPPPGPTEGEGELGEGGGECEDVDNYCRA